MQMLFGTVISLLNCAWLAAGQTRTYILNELYDAADLPTKIADYDFIARRGVVDALITINGPMTAGSTNTMSYEWFESEDAGPASENRVQLFLNQEIYIDDDGFISTTGTVPLVKDSQLDGLGEKVSGRQFVKDWFGRNLKKCAIPAWTYDFGADRILIDTSAMLFWGGSAELFEAIYIPSDFGNSAYYGRFT